MKRLSILPGLLVCLGTLLLFATPSMAQGGDDCASATPIAGYGTFAFDNTNATATGIADCNGIPVRKDLWFSWTAPVTGEVRFGTCGTSTPFDTRIVAYSNTNCGALSVLACAAQSCMGLSEVTFSAVMGQSYLLRVGSRQVGTGGAGSFRLRDEPCPSTFDDNLEDNDTCADATPMMDGTFPGLFVSKPDFDWYSFCVPGNGTVTMDLLFTDADGDIDIFLFDGCTAGASLGIGGSGDDNETLMYTNTATTPVEVFLRVELWIDDPTQDCNNYTFVLSGSIGSCSGVSVGTNYCVAAPNVTGVPAGLSALGSDVVADNNLLLEGSQMPINQFSFFITSMTQGFVMNPGGSAGNLCLSGGIGRFVLPGQIQQSNAAGMISLGINLLVIPTPLGAVSVAAGETWNFQAWYRDFTPTGGSTSNFTDGLEITFQ